MHPRLRLRLWKWHHCCCFDGGEFFFLSSFRNIARSLKIARRQRRCTHTQTWGECLALSLVQCHSARKQQQWSYPLCWKQTPWKIFCLSIISCLSVSGHLHTPACRNIRGVEICEATPGTWQPVTAMIRLSSDWWVADGRVKMSRKCAASQWQC